MCKRLQISEQTFDRWRIRCGALKEDEAERLKTIEQENARLTASSRSRCDIAMLKDLQREEW